MVGEEEMRRRLRRSLRRSCNGAVLMRLVSMERRLLRKFLLTHFEFTVRCRENDLSGAFEGCSHLISILVRYTNALNHN